MARNLMQITHRLQSFVSTSGLTDVVANIPLARYGGRQIVASLPGDGIGPEMFSHLRSIFMVAQVPVDFEFVPLSMKKSEDEEMENAVIALKRNGIGIKGSIEMRYDMPNFHSRNAELRTRLDLYVNLIHCKNLPNVRAKHQNVDIIMIRENTEGEYSGLEHEIVPGVIESLKVFTRRKIERIARYACECAKRCNRTKITAIHKANIMKLSDSLFLNVCKDMIGHYSGLQFDSMIIDNASMQLVTNPHQFDVILMPNLYGNILSSIGCGIVGGQGVLPSANFGDRYAIFEPASQYTCANLVGKDLANPCVFILAGINMLRHIKLDDYAELLQKSLYKVMFDDMIQTPDIGGTFHTSDIIENIKAEVIKRMQASKRG